MPLHTFNNLMQTIFNATGGAAAGGADLSNFNYSQMLGYKHESGGFHLG